MYVLGIHEDGSYFKVALIKRVGGTLSIQFIQEFKKDIHNLTVLKKKLTNELKIEDSNIHSVSCLLSHKIYTKTLNIDFSSKKELKKLLPFQLEAILPFSEKEALIIPHIKKKGKGGSVEILGVRNSDLQSHIQSVKNLGFDPDSITSDGQALLSFTNMFASDHHTFIVLHLGWENSSVVLIEKEKLIHSLSIKLGLRSLVDALKIDFPTLNDFDFAFLKSKVEKMAISESSNSGVFHENVAHLQKNLLRRFAYLQKLPQYKNIEGVIFTGYSEILENFVQQKNEIALKKLSLTPHLEYDRLQLASYAIEIGAALSHFSKKPLQLRNKDFPSTKQKNNLRRTFKKAALTFSLLLFSSLIFCGTRILQKESYLKRRFQNITTINYLSPSPYPSLNKGRIKPHQFEEDLTKLTQELSQINTEKKYLQPTPLLSPLLCSINSTLANFAYIKSLKYELVQFPTLEASNLDNKRKITLSLVMINKNDPNIIIKKLKEAPSILDQNEEVNIVKGKDEIQICFYIKE